MTLSPDPPQRDATPEERRRSARLFWTILLLFLLTVGVLATYLSMRGRALRDYGHSVYVAAQQSSGQSGAATRPCTDFWTAPPPPDVKSCEVRGQGDGRKVVVTLQNAQQYQITR